MRTVSEVYKALALTSLKSAGFITDDKISIESWGKPEVLALINEGLTRLHSRFQLKTNNCIVEMKEGRTEYPLQKIYSYEHFDPTRVQYPFIMDTPQEPFQEDVIKILNVYDNKGNRRTLNDTGSNNEGLFTPRPDTLQAIWPRKFEALNVQYQAKHKELVLDGEYVDLPETLYSALENWVGYRYHTGLNTEGSTAKAAEYLQLYESICGEITDHALVGHTDSFTNFNFEKRGWK